MIWKRKSVVSNRHSRKQKRRYVVFGIIVALALILLTWGISKLWNADFMSISSIEVSGVPDVAVEDVKQLAMDRISDNYLFMFSKRNIVFYPKQMLIRDIVASDSHFQSVAIKTLNMKSISIAVTEKNAYALWCVNITTKKNCFQMDNLGQVFDLASSTSVMNYVVWTNNNISKDVNIGSVISDQDEFLKLKSFADGLIKFGFKLSTVYIKTDGQYEFVNEVGQSLYLSKKDDFDLALHNFEIFWNEKVLKQKEVIKQYIDLRFGNKIFFK